MGQSAAVFHWAPTLALGVHFSDMARPSSTYNYMWLSTLLGLALTVWFFFGCGLDGKYLVATVAPLMASCSAWSSDRWLSSQADKRDKVRRERRASSTFELDAAQIS